VNITGPLQSSVGQLVTYTMTLTNTGRTPLTQVRIVNTYEPSLYPKNASRGLDPNALRRAELIWTIDRVDPGQTVSREAQYECIREARAAWSRVYADAAQGVRATKETTTQISAAQTSPPRETEPPLTQPPTQPKPQPQPITGQLRVSIANTRNPIPVNTNTTFIITIENGQNVPDRNVQLTILLPPGLDYVALRGPQGARSSSDDRRTIEIEPFREVRASETLNPFFLEVRGNRIGKHTVKVRVDSFRSTQPIEATEDTTVNVGG
jgi:hypothetical protein